MASAYNRFVANEVKHRPAGMSVQQAFKQAARNWHNKRGADEIRRPSRKNPSSNTTWLWIGAGALGLYLWSQHKKKQDAAKIPASSGPNAIAAAYPG